MIYDELMNSDIVRNSNAPWVPYLTQAQVFRIDDVSQYYWQNHQQNWDIEDFPNIAPPYQTFWMEYSIPRMIRVNGKATTVPIKTRNGILILVDDTDDADSARWSMYAMIFTKVNDSDVVKFDFGWQCFVNSDGSFATSASGKSRLTLDILPDVYETTNKLLSEFSENHPEDPINQVDPSKNLVVYLHPVWLALSFLNCKNTTTTLIEPKQKRKQKRRKRGGSNGTQKEKPYHVLNIPMFKRVLSELGQKRGKASAGKSIGMHFSRAHFKTYSEDAPLFGKRVGTWFWGFQTRGAGALNQKRYNLKDNR